MNRTYIDGALLFQYQNRGLDSIGLSISLDDVQPQNNGWQACNRSALPSLQLAVSYVRL